MTQLEVLVFVTICFSGLALVARADEGSPGRQRAQRFETQIPVELYYWLYVPEEYGKDEKKKFPVILFLHGAGERGAQIADVSRHGPPKLLKNGTDLPLKDFVVISPQCKPDRWWQPFELLALMDHLMKELKHVDTDRVYLTGMSMGGFGTWELATIAGDRFAAIAPVCGGGNPLLAPILRNMPVWAFHGDNDKVVPVERSIEMVEALKKVGNEPQFTRYPDAGHDSWTETYSNPELYEWFLKHKRSDRPSEKRGR